MFKEDCEEGGIAIRMRKPGLSDTFFYYMNTGERTMDSRFCVRLIDELNEDALIQAASISLGFYPEFAIKPVVYNGAICFAENHNPVKVLHAEKKAADISIEFGTDVTNGHVCVFIIENDRRSLTFSYYHGMSDYKGAISIFRTIMYNYGLQTGKIQEADRETLDSACIRTSIPDNWDQEMLLDPYGYYGSIASSKDKKTSGVAQNTVTAFSPDIIVNSSDDPLSHVYHITASTQAIKTKAKENGTSFAPFIISILSNAIANCYDGKDADIVSVMPADFRRIYNSDTIVNFSDSVKIISSGETRKLNKADECAVYKSMIEDGRNIDNVDALIVDKAETTRNFINANNYLEIVDGILHPKNPPSGPAPMTFVITYPGIIDMPEILDGLIDNMYLEMVSPRLKFYFVVHSYKDDLMIQVIQHFDRDELAKAISDEFNANNIKSVIEDCGMHNRNILNAFSLEVINE